MNNFRIEKRKVSELKPFIHLEAVIPIKIQPIVINSKNEVITLRGCVILASAVAEGLEEVDVIVDKKPEIFEFVSQVSQLPHV